MRTLTAVDVSGAPDNVLHMSKMIQVRNVPDELHRELKVRAAQEGMTLSDFIKRELGWMAAKPSFEEVAKRVEARGPSGLSTETIVQVIREGRE